MGATLSTPESPNPSTSSSQPTPEQEPSNPLLDEAEKPSQSDGEVGGEVEEEEEGECGFCLFMKGGGCREKFVAWEKCFEEGENNKEDIVEKCYTITTALKVCMEAQPEYYGPILMAEKAAEAKAVKELEEKESQESESVVTIGEMENEENVRDSEGKEAS